MVKRSAQNEAPERLTNTESERHYQMSDQLTIKDWFLSFFR